MKPLIPQTNYFFKAGDFNQLKYTLLMLKGS
jgi:hypothetical protein